MTDTTTERTPAEQLRRLVLAFALAASAFWVYTFFHISRVANPKGDGMEWMAAFPMTFIFLLFVLPALIAALSAGRSPRTLKIFAVVLALGIVADIYVWSQILGEFAGKPPR